MTSGITSNYSGYSNYSNYSNSSNSSSSSSSSRSSSDTPSPELKQQLISLGIPESTISAGREAVMQYAQSHNITMPKPPEQSGNSNSIMSGNSSSSNNSPSAEFKQQLVSLGIPESKIEEGREAVMAYAKENNIELPKPPSTGGSLNIQA